MSSSFTKNGVLSRPVVTVFLFILACQLLTALPHAVVTDYRDTLNVSALNADKNRLPEETCKLYNTTYIDHFPNARNCNTFFTCVLVEDGVTRAIEEPCPVYTDTATGAKKLLIWNFATCKCDYPWNSQCYNPYNDTHSTHRYKCAKKLEENEINSGSNILSALPSSQETETKNRHGWLSSLITFVSNL